ncbi:MAG TPA: hypothetical protein VL442_06415 [Mucilaginibacter sp.]|nr:hypothetical protein [Mucilaginibacter sp.]
MKKEPILTIAAIGFLTGCVLGMTGSFVPSDIARSILWAIDSSGIILASALLALYLSKKGQDIAAAGFIIFAIAESIVFASSSVDLNASLSAFAAGVFLWALSIAVVSSQKVFPIFLRCTGIITALLFAITAFQIFMGHPATP